MGKNLSGIVINASEKLVPVDGNDLEFLRQGKNSNRASFFHQAVITRSDQRDWFSRYQNTNTEHMFVIYSNTERVGVLGLRILETGKAELYNVMRVGERNTETQGLMSRALDALVQHYNMIHGIDEFIALVVQGNEALKWYLRNGFRVLSEDDKGVYIGRRGSTRSA